MSVKHRQVQPVVRESKVSARGRDGPGRCCNVLGNHLTIVMLRVTSTDPTSSR